MYGTQSHQVEVKVPASKAWQHCRGTDVAILGGKQLNDVFEKVEVVEGIGGPGTVLKFTFKKGKGPGNSTYLKEKLMVVDDNKRVKQSEVLEGGGLGFNYFRVRFEVKKRRARANCCVLKTTVEYEVNEEGVDYASLVTIKPFVKVMEFAADYLLKYV